jgi:nitrogen fixation/metabolism regulation signal transduction histidine kinase
MEADTIRRCAAEIPEEWYEGDRDGLDRLVAALYDRRGTIRRLITEFRKSTRNPFPSWEDSPRSVALSAVGQDEALEIR